MKKLLVIVFCFCFCCPWGGKAQDELYRMELGGGLGGAFYIGDANSKPFANLGPMGSIVARYIFNPRMAIKGNLAVGHISGDTGADFFPQDAGSGDAVSSRHSSIRNEHRFFMSPPAPRVPSCARRTPGTGPSHRR